LLDYKAWAESQGLKPALFEPTSITVSELNSVAASQGVIFQPGDILFIHSGYVRALEALKGDDAKNYTSNPPPKAIGVKSGEEMLKWIWEKQFAAVASDMLAFEALPFQSTDYWLHEWLLAGWGMPIGELFDLEKLAEECKRLKKWSFFYSSVPLKVCPRFAKSEVLD
jgi:kynurenine formamidase